MELLLKDEVYAVVGAAMAVRSLRRTRKRKKTDPRICTNRHE